jgi:guanine deaminase
MDKSTRPTYKEESTHASLAAAKLFIQDVRKQVSIHPEHRRLVEPVVTPRFVPTCSDELLLGLGELSNAEEVRVQSHLAEAHDQVKWVRDERHAEDIEVFERVCDIDHKSSGSLKICQRVTSSPRVRSKHTARF